MTLPTLTLTLATATVIAPKVKHFAFRYENCDFNYIPGQFITIHFEKEGQPLKRSYSIATIPGTHNYLEFAAGYVDNGPASDYLFNLQPGDRVTISGPFGRLILKEEEAPQRYILAATSTGITPYRAMLPKLKQRLSNPHVKVVVLEGVQYRQDLLYATDFLEVAREYANFNFYACYSRETLAEATLWERSGYVQNQFVDLKLNPATDIIYLCGNPAMIDQSFDYLKAGGFDVKNIRREKYISSK